MKAIQYFLGILFAFFLILILLISAVDIVAYRIPGYYRYEFTKHASAQRVGMDMEELLRVKEQMMDYLRGERESLSDISATIRGKEGAFFFNEREIAHMEDVRDLFLKALMLRRILCLLALGTVILIWILRGRPLKILSKTLMIGSGLFFVLVVLFAGLLAADFSKYFIVFHQIFFDNDLWMLDPAVDNLINIVPEGFFFETAICIMLVFSLLLALTLAGIRLIAGSGEGGTKNP